MTRLRVLLAGAAALVVGGGITLGAALLDFGQSMSPRMGCAEFTELLDRVQYPPQITAFVAAQDGYVVPAAVANPSGDDRVIGNCGSGVCTIKGNNCNATHTYRFETSALVGGWRLAKIVAHPYSVGAWKIMAAADPALKFWDSYAGVQAACLANLTALQCRNIMGSVNDCWLRTDGQLCRNGFLFGPGEGGETACTVGVTDTWYPCEDDGHGYDYGDRSQTEPFPQDSELDLPDE